MQKNEKKRGKYRTSNGLKGLHIQLSLIELQHPIIGFEQKDIEH